MSSYLWIADWHANQRVREIDAFTGVFASKVSKRTGEVSGFFFKRTRRDPVICFQNNGFHGVSCKGKLISLVDPDLLVRLSAAWPKVKLEFAHPEMTFVISEYAPLGLLVARIDPGFDWLDWNTRFFSCYLYEQYLVANKKDS